MVRYTIAVAHLNMVDTVEPSMRSILDQITDEYEVLVVDGGSTDGSLEVLRRLDAEDERFRLIELPPDPERLLGADRHISVQRARGEFVLPQLDADDYFPPYIQDFVEIYHMIEPHRDNDFMLIGGGLMMAPRRLLLEVSYRNLRTTEDKDLWRRLLVRDQLLFLETKPEIKSIGYHRSKVEALKAREIHKKIATFQTGVTLGSAYRWTFRENLLGIRDGLTRERTPLYRVLKFFFDVAMFLPTWLLAKTRPRFDLPPEMRDRGALGVAIAENRKPLSVLAKKLDFTVDWGALSPIGRRVYLEPLAEQD